MNKKYITFQIDERKFTIKLVPDTKPQNKIHYYTMSKSKDIIDLTLTENDITEAIEGDDEEHPIMIRLEENSILSDSETEMISKNLKNKLLNEAIASYKNKYRQYIEQRKAKQLANYLKQQAKDIIKKFLR